MKTKMDSQRMKARSACGPDMKAMMGHGGAVSSGRKSTPQKFAAGGAAKVRLGVATPAGKPRNKAGR